MRFSAIHDGKNSILTFNYNRLDELEKILKDNSVAAIKMEVIRNAAPKDNFLKKVRELADKHGSVLIFDECTTGFRETFGGIHKRYGVEPDIAIFGKTMGVVGLGAIGKEVSKRALALGLQVIAFDIFKDEVFLSQHPEIIFAEEVDKIYEEADIITLHIPHTPDSERMINQEVIQTKLKKKPVIINTSRGMLIDTDSVIKGLKEGQLRGYLTDVLITEPITENEKLKGVENVIITPHVGSRTFQSVERQGLMAVNNLIKLINIENQT